jgi:RNA polymerase sigma-70 factor, ECF subfamily
MRGIGTGLSPRDPRDQGRAQVVPAASGGNSVSPTGPPAVPRKSDQLDLQSTVDLTIRARAGDQQALEALCLRCLKSMSRYAAGRLPAGVRGMIETQDIVQEAVQRGMCRLHEFETRHQGALIAYMRKTLKNLIIDYVRASVRRPMQVSLDGDHTVADDSRSPLEHVLDAEQIERYEAALARLKPRDADLIRLKIEEHLTHDEIAVELGLPSGNAARIALKRAVMRLAHEMATVTSASKRAGEKA